MDARILLVGDPTSVGMAWKDDLVEAGATVSTVTNGSDALRHLDLIAPDVVLIDVKLPGRLDGFDTCRAIRSRSAVIVVLAAICPGAFDEVVALAVGADHFLSGDTLGQIAIARLGALLRRVRQGVHSDDVAVHNGSHSDTGRSASAAEPEMERVTAGDLEIDLVAREVRVKDGVAQLTRIEFDLLVTLARQPRRVFTREQLMSRAWDQPFDGSHVLDTHLSRLRRKIEAVGGARVAHAVRGVGYRLHS
jgi:two-component system, OmpR family, response regulator MtrA